MNPLIEDESGTEIVNNPKGFKMPYKIYGRMEKEQMYKKYMSLQPLASQGTLIVTDFTL